MERKNVNVRSVKERHLVEYAHHVILDLYGDYDLVLVERRIGAVIPDMIFVLSHEPWLVAVELELDADNPYCKYQCFRYAFYAPTIVVCEHVSTNSLNYYRKHGIGIAIRDKILLTPKLIYVTPDIVKELYNMIKFRRKMRL